MSSDDGEEKINCQNCMRPNRHEIPLLWQAFFKPVKKFVKIIFLEVKARLEGTEDISNVHLTSFPCCYGIEDNLYEMSLVDRMIWLNFLIGLSGF